MQRPLRVRDFEIAVALARQNVLNFAMTEIVGDLPLARFT